MHLFRIENYDIQCIIKAFSLIDKLGNWKALKRALIRMINMGLSGLFIVLSTNNFNNSIVYMNISEFVLSNSNKVSIIFIFLSIYFEIFISDAHEVRNKTVII